MNNNKFSILSIPTLSAIDNSIAKFPFSIDFVKGNYPEIKIIIKDSQFSIFYKNHNIKDFSFVWVTSQWLNRDLAYAIDLYLKKSETPHTSVEYEASKITDTLTFAINNLPVPDSIYVNRAHIKNEIELITKICGFPLIIKDIKGSQGRDSFYVEDENSLLDIINDLPVEKRFLFQKFIPNEYDWGIMVSNGIVVAGEKSYPANNEFRNNAINGAKEEFVNIANIPQEIKDIAIESSSLLNLSWSRADIIIDKNTNLPYLLEVNRYPGITIGSDEILGAYTFLNSHIEELSLSKS